jgi:thiol-disulfide isomerase/thioredoxin
MPIRRPIGRRAVLTGLAGAAAAGLAPVPGFAQAVQRFNVGQPLVDFCAIDADKRLVSTADWRGQVLFVHWFGSWCPPCRKEIPELAQLEKQFDGRADVRFVFLNGLEKVGATKKWLASIDTSVALYDSSHTSRQDQYVSLLTGERAHGYKDLGLSLYPSSWLVDRRGVIRRAWPAGQAGWANWGKNFLEDLAKENVPAPGTANVDWLVGAWPGELAEYGKRAVRVEKAADGKLNVRWIGAESRAAALKILWGDENRALLADPESWKNGGNGVRLLARATGEMTGTFLLGKDRDLLKVTLSKQAA